MNKTYLDCDLSGVVPSTEYRINGGKNPDRSGNDLERKGKWLKKKNVLKHGSTSNEGPDFSDVWLQCINNKKVVTRMTCSKDGVLNFTPPDCKPIGCNTDDLGKFQKYFISLKRITFQELNF